MDNLQEIKKWKMKKSQKNKKLISINRKKIRLFKIIIKEKAKY